MRLFLSAFSPHKKGHKEEILCAAHCPPSLLATGSYDGEVIVWDVLSGRVQCRLVSPSSSDERRRTDGDVLTSDASSRCFSYRAFTWLCFLNGQDLLQVLQASFS